MRGWVIAVALVAAGCSNENLEKMEVQDLTASEPAAAGAAATAPLQIAYSYRLSYRLDDEAIDRVQAAHMTLCDKLGLARCRIVSMARSGSEGAFARGTLKLLVDARIARSLGRALDKAAAGAGGETIDRGIEAEDLSKTMIDTDARIAAKQALADRLRVLIARGARVADLVEAERAFAQAQEELDAARTSMAEMLGRVAQSRIEVSYESRSAGRGSLFGPVRDALREAGSLLGNSLGALITFVIVVLPWALLLVGLVWLLRRIGWHPRWPWRRRASLRE